MEDFVKCMVCGDHFKHIAIAHLRKHNLTMREYRQTYPQAPLTALLVRQKISLKSSSRVFHRNCRNCGQPFITGNARVFFCSKCQAAISREKTRKRKQRYNKLYKKRTKRFKVKNPGTFGEDYLDVVNNRVRGAVLLEKGVSVNGSSAWFTKYLKKFLCGDCGFDYVILDGRLFCGECGSKIIVARENKYYTIPAELCCKNCGIVFQLT